MSRQVDNDTVQVRISRSLRDALKIDAAINKTTIGHLIEVKFNWPKLIEPDLVQVAEDIFRPSVTYHQEPLKRKGR